jgi:sirohydrochlorin cobaltochelatase
MCDATPIARELSALDQRIRTLLPEQYRERYDEVRPVSMGSAGLKYDSEGRVAWDAIWGSFCDLAMAGGPPHRGTLLEPPPPATIAVDSDAYSSVVAELCRGIGMVTGLFARPSKDIGWVRVDCTSAAMAGWLARAIVMENVSARSRGLVLLLPAAPGYRMEKEIKNVITAMAKTCHYWLDHMSQDQHWAINDLFRAMERKTPLLQTSHPEDSADGETRQALSQCVADLLPRLTGLRAVPNASHRWLGIDCGGVQQAIWMMRALCASNVFSRREGCSVFVPLNPFRDPEGDLIARAFAIVYRLAVLRGVFQDA